MQQKILKTQTKAQKGYIIVPNYFLRECIKTLGAGPAMFYQYLLTYCHKGNNTAWPALSTSSEDTGLSQKTLTKYYRILVAFGLIEKVTKAKSSPDGHTRNIYQLVQLHREKIPCIREKFTMRSGKILRSPQGKKYHITITI